jgi:hypothetical protein
MRPSKKEYLEKVMFPMLDTLFCERNTEYENQYRWGHEIGKIFVYLDYTFGDEYVKAYMSPEDTEGYNLHGPLCLIDYIWTMGYNVGNPKEKYGP